MEPVNTTPVNTTPVNMMPVITTPVNTTPVNMMPTVVKRSKRKWREVVLGNDKEFSGQQIKSQFDDYNDLLQSKCFPPPSKKAMIWREMAGCEQLYSNPTFPGLMKPLKMLIKRHYTTSLEFVDFPLDTSLLNERLKPITMSTKTPQADKPGAITSESEPARLNKPADLGFADSGGQIAAAALETASETDLEDMKANAEPSDKSMKSTTEQMLNDLFEEYEQRRWTKCTQQVTQVLDRKLKKTDTVAISSLTNKSKVD